MIACICAADGLAVMPCAAFKTRFTAADNWLTWVENAPPASAFSAASCVWMLVTSFLICADALALSWRCVRFSSEEFSEATCLQVAADAVAVIDGLAATLVVLGVAVLVEPPLLVPELHAARSAALPTIKIADLNLTGHLCGCLVMLLMLPRRQHLDVTPGGRDRLRRKAWNDCDCTAYRNYRKYHLV